MRFGRTKVWAEDDWDAARSFCPLHFSFVVHASLTRTCNWLFSLMSANCLGLRPPAVMSVGLFPPMQAFSSADRNALLEHHDLRFSSWSSLKKTALGMHTSHILVTWPAQRSCTRSKMDSKLGRLALLRTSSFDMWSCLLMLRMEREQRWLVKPLQ